MTQPLEGAGDHLSPGVSGALRQFAYWVANGTVGHPLLEGIDYWDDMRESPSLMEQVFAIFANVLVVDTEGNPVNAKEAERRAAMWIRQYCSRTPAEPPLEGWEVELHPPPR
ncbi:MAG TPA: hypothetical protein VFA11_09525 [Acidimicrobiales bacterium]|nr:hypothetical protein [Acidimicrobiales bacterium]